jgi:hypothetical protein
MWRAVVNTVMNFTVPYNAGSTLTCCANISPFVGTLLHRVSSTLHASVLIQMQCLCALQIAQVGGRGRTHKHFAAPPSGNWFAVSRDAGYASPGPGLERLIYRWSQLSGQRRLVWVILLGPSFIASQQLVQRRLTL